MINKLFSTSSFENIDYSEYKTIETKFKKLVLNFCLILTMAVAMTLAIVRFFVADNSILIVLPLIVGTLVLMTAFYFANCKHQLDIAATIFALLIPTFSFVRFLQTFHSDLSFVYPSSSYAGFITIVYVLKGRKWGISVASFLSLMLFIKICQLAQDKGNLETNFTLFNTLVWTILINIVLYIVEWKNSLLQLLIKKFEQRKISESMIRRLLHEILNPLSIAKGYLDLLDINKKHVSAETLSEHRSKISFALDRIDLLTRSMGLYSKYGNLSNLIQIHENDINLVHTITQVLDPNKPVSILLVGPSSTDSAAINSFLSETPYKLFEAQNEQEAIKLYQDEIFDIVLVNMEMPNKEGDSTTRAIRQWEREQNLVPVPIIALFSSAQVTEQLQSLEAGCNLYVSKPISHQKLVNLINHYTRNLVLE